MEEFEYVSWNSVYILEKYIDKFAGLGLFSMSTNFCKLQ